MVYAFQMQKSACNTCGPCIACTLYILYRDVFVHIYMHRYSIRTCNRSRSPVAVARGPWPVARCRGGEDASQPSFMAAKYAIINWAIVAEWEKGQRGRGRGRDGGAKDGFGGCVAPPVCGAHVMSIFVAHFSAYVCVWASVLWGKVYASYFYSISVSPLRLRPLEFPTIFSLGEILRTEFPLDSRRGAGVEAWHLGKKKTRGIVVIYSLQGEIYIYKEDVNIYRYIFIYNMCVEKQRIWFAFMLFFLFLLSFLAFLWPLSLVSAFNGRQMEKGSERWIQVLRFPESVGLCQSQTHTRSFLFFFFFAKLSALTTSFSRNFNFASKNSLCIGQHFIEFPSSPH